MMKDGTGARAEFETAVQKSPDYFPAQFSLGVLYQAEGKQDPAIAHFEEALRARVLSCDEPQLLQRWRIRALSVAAAGEVFLAEEPR